MTESLQFDRAEFSASKACGKCQAALVSSYFEANGTVLCGGCAEHVRKLIDGTGSRLGRFTRATLLGLGAAVLGSVGYYWFSELTNSNWALVAIGVGMFVGRSVRRGSGGRGGWRYQILAAFLTYAAIVGTFVPSVIQELRDSPDKKPAIEHVKTADLATSSAASNSDAASPAAKPEANASQAASSDESEPQILAATPAPVRLAIAIAMITGLLFSVPVMIGTSSPISLLIYGFGVWEAWRLNRRVPLTVTGPHSLAATPSSVPNATV